MNGNVAMFKIPNNWKELAGSERGVSPVIGVVLMVAITVILAATIGAIVLGMGDTISQPVSAGASVDADTGNDRISVTFTSSAKSGTTLDVDFTQINGGGNDTATLSSVGDSYTSTFADGNEVKVVVTAVNDDRTTVIREETFTL